MRTILVAVDSRATWSRALTVCEAIQRREDLQLMLICMGPLADQQPHELDGIPVYYHLKLKIPEFYTTYSLSLGSMAELAGHYTNHLGGIIELKKPDIVVSVTDRYESLAVAVAAALSNVHLAHIQGGEVSGSLDESMRHAITKLAHIHFPANQDSADRIVRMGEDPAYVFNVGCPATDLLLRVNLGEPPAQPYILVSYNPVTTIPVKDNYHHTWCAVGAAQSMGSAFGCEVIAIGPNHDPGNKEVWAALHDAGLQADPSLPHADFVRLMAHASVMVGNGSAGIREAAYWGVPVVDVGVRQQGRACSRNVLTVTAPDRDLIQMAIAAQLEHGRYPPEQPFGSGGAGEKIAELLATMELPPIQKRIRY